MANNLKPSEKTALCFIVFTAIILCGGQILTALKIGNNLSPIADAYSESNAIRAGEGYYDVGFKKNAGLPMTKYGDKFPNRGHLKYKKYWAKDKVYIRYPPGPDLIVGVLTKIFGKGQIMLFRIWPLTVGFISMFIFIKTLLRYFGSRRTAIIFACCALAPMFTNMMHGLHVQSYTLHLHLIEIAVLLTLFQDPAADLRVSMPALFLLGFLQGWLTFDFVFLVILAPLPFYFFYKTELNEKARYYCLLAILWLAAGFVTAHLLHLLQVIAYTGPQEVFEDWKRSAIFRSGISDTEIHRTFIFQKYAQILPTDRYFGWMMPVVIILSTFFLLMQKVTLDLRRPFQSKIQIKLDFKSTLFSILSALLVSAAWITVMKNHAHNHLHFIPRHFFYFYFWGLFAVISKIQILEADRGDEQL